MPDSGILNRFSLRLDGAGAVMPDGADDEEETEVGPGNAFGAVTGQRTAQALDFHCRDDQAFSVPYLFGPITWRQGAHAVILEYPSLFSVLLRGQNLEALRQRIRDRKIAWIRECEPEEAESLPMAVTAIRILDVYPSRLGGGLDAIGEK
jgi:hypothetical protein